MSTPLNSSAPVRATGERLLTINDHRRWEIKFAPVLDEVQAERDRSFAEAENARFVKAQDAVLRALQSFRKRGLSLDEAGAVLQHSCGVHSGYTYTDLMRVLQALGWKPGAKLRDREAWFVQRT